MMNDDKANDATANDDTRKADLLRRDKARDEDLEGPRTKAPPSIERNRHKDLPNQDYQERLDQGETRSDGMKTDADLHGSGAPIPTLGSNAANSDLIENRSPVQPNMSGEERHEQLLHKEDLKEADLATRDPDPLG